MRGRPTLSGHITGGHHFCLLFSLTPLDFPLHLAHDGVEVVLMLDLQLLVVAAALVRSALLQDFRYPVEHLGPSPRFLGHEVLGVLHHELQVDLIL